MNGLMGKQELNYCYYQKTSISFCNDHIPIINKKYNLKEYKAITSTIIINTLIRQLRLVSSFSKSEFQPQVGYTQSSSSVIDFVIFSDDFLPILWFFSPHEGI